MKKNKISKNWINKQKKDIYIIESKKQGYRSRSAFKLIEIDQKFNFLSNTKLFLDLGSAPGGWSQVASEIISKGKILASDARARSDEIMGVKSYKAWESFSARLRKKLHLKSETNDQNMKPFWSRK